MIGLILVYGSIGGLIVAVPMVWHMLSLAPGEAPMMSMLLTYLVMLVALTSVFLGIKSYRDKVLGGAIRFLPAFCLGLAISAVASLFYVVGWEISMAYTNFEFTNWYANFMVESVRARGGTAAELAQAAADAQAFRAMYAQPLNRMSMTFVEMFPVGLLVSLISAAVLRNSRVLPARQPA